jgi:hypothetical protein
VSIDEIEAFGGHASLHWTGEDASIIRPAAGANASIPRQRGLAPALPDCGDELLFCTTQL